MTEKGTTRNVRPPEMASRFRGFLPVAVDVETGGFNAATDALLEIAAVLVEMNEDGTLERGETSVITWRRFPARVSKRLPWKSME